MAMPKSHRDVPGPAAGSLVRVENAGEVLAPLGEGSLATPGTAAQLVNGQTINVVTNHNLHLSFREWMLRGVVGAVGTSLAFPFRLIESAATGIVQALIGIAKLAAIIILVPTLIWLGVQLHQQMVTKDSVEEGAAYLTQKTGEFATGVARGVSSEEGDQKP